MMVGGEGRRGDTPVLSWFFRAVARLRSRKKKQKGGLLTSQARMLIQENGCKPWVEDAVPQEEFAGICQTQHPGKSRGQLLWHMAQLKNGSKKLQAFQRTEERQCPEMPAQTAERCTKPKRKAPAPPELPRTCQKATRGGEAQQEEQVALVTAFNILNMDPCVKEDGQKELIVRHDDQNGEVLRESGGHRDEMSQTHLLDEEGRTTGSPQSPGLWVEDKDAAITPRGNGQDFNSPEGTSGEEQRRQVWEKLHYLGEDMARWGERSTKDLAVRLMEVILLTETQMYPTETGNKSNCLKQGEGGARSKVGSLEVVDALVDTHVDVTKMQYLAVVHNVPVSIGGTMYGDDQHLPTLAELFENEQIWDDPDNHLLDFYDFHYDDNDLLDDDDDLLDDDDDLLDDDDDLLEQGSPPALPMPTVHIYCARVARDEEWWKKEFPGVWAQSEMDCGLVSGEVKVTGITMAFQRQPPLSEHVEEAVESVLQDLLKEGVVVKGSSACNSPLKLIQKRNGKIRLGLNCKALNKATDKQVSLDRTKLITTLSPESRYFSVVDLSNASFAIPLEASSRANFAFTFREQQYLFTRLPVGFQSTTSILHQRVDQMLSQLAPEDKAWVISYKDDILIAGRYELETRRRTIRVLELIQKTGFKAKFEKAQLVCPEVDYLGMTIGPQGRKIQASKLEAILKASPQNAKGLRSLLGKFLQDHIPGYWELARPLHLLATEKIRWRWGLKQEQMLKRLKDALQAAPPLRFPNKSQPFVIRLMISKRVIGATLLQEDHRRHLVPVGHTSCMLKNHQISYLAQEKECLAAIWAMKKFENLMEMAPILIEIPHSPWKYLLRGKLLLLNQHPGQWSLLLVNRGVMARGPQPALGQFPDSPICDAPPLQQLSNHVPKANIWFTGSEKIHSIACYAAVNLEERWLLGVANVRYVPDAEVVALQHLLDRHHCSSPLYFYTSRWSLVERFQSDIDEGQWGECGSSSQDLWPSILQWVHKNPGILHIRFVGGSQDPEERRWNQEAHRRAEVLSDNMILRSEYCWEPSKHEKQEIVAQCHSWWHEGVEETFRRVSQVALWEGSYKQVAHWVQSCLKCREGEGKVPPQRVEGPWSLLQLECINNLPKTPEGHCSLLVVGDEFSGWVEAFLMRESTVTEAAKVLQEFFAQYGAPRAVRLLRGSGFLQDTMEQVRVTTDVEVLQDILQPGQAGSVMASLTRLVQGAGMQWAKMLPLLLGWLRSVRVQPVALSSLQMIPGIPLEMWEHNDKHPPQGNILHWLSELQEDETGYKHQIKAASS